MQYLNLRESLFEIRRARRIRLTSLRDEAGDLPGEFINARLRLPGIHGRCTRLHVRGFLPGQYAIKQIGTEPLATKHNRRCHARHRECSNHKGICANVVLLLFEGHGLASIVRPDKRHVK
jgi:hypothetical protein